MKEDFLVLVNESLADAERALGQATEETRVDHCEKYLFRLSEYSDRLYELHGTQELSGKQNSPMVRELILQVRKAILTALHNNVREKNRVESLLKSFTEINSHQAADVDF